MGDGKHDLFFKYIDSTESLQLSDITGETYSWISPSHDGNFLTVGNQDTDSSIYMLDVSKLPEINKNRITHTWDYGSKFSSDDSKIYYKSYSSNLGRWILKYLDINTKESKTVSGSKIGKYKGLLF